MTGIGELALEVTAIGKILFFGFLILFIITFFYGRSPKKDF